MPTIAEMLAAKAKKQVPSAAVVEPVAKSTPRESLADQIAAKEAIDRIDPPGKRRGGSLVLDSKPMPADTKPVLPADPRALGARVGEALNVVPVNPTAQAVAWDEVLNRWETDLIIMADPEPGSESAWLALKPITGSGLPIMLHKLPFWPHPQRVMKENEPF